jgi:hypothetical protein
MRILLVIVLCINYFSFSQAIIDTSYTINSTYTKEIKKFPFIKKAVFQYNEEIE